MCHRYRYYFGWLVAQGACIMSGLGYDPQKDNWEAVENVRVLDIEVGRLAPHKSTAHAHICCVQFAGNIKGVVDNWNMCANRWLKRYIYLRISPEGTKAPLSTTLVTYFVSAFWHGFYPGYYLCFLMAGVVTQVARDLRRTLRPHFVTKVEENGLSKEVAKSSKIIYDVACWLLNISVLHYVVYSFVVLRMDYACTCFRRARFSGRAVRSCLLALQLPSTVACTTAAMLWSLPPWCSSSACARVSLLLMTTVCSRAV
jgi:lysophospholipid acyltransferase